MSDDTRRWSAQDINESPPRRRRRIGLIVAVLVGVFIVADIVLLVNSPAAPEHRPVEVKGDGYVSSGACRDCHRSQYDSWHATYHRTMTQLPSPESVLGRFDGSEAQVDDLKASFQRHGNAYQIHTTDGEGNTEVHDVKLTSGSHHMLVYWVSTGRERELAKIPFTYLREEDRWVPERAVFIRPPGSSVEFDVGRWNKICIACHTTHPVSGMRDDHVDTRVAEFGISCEACHGPGEAHVRFQNGEEDVSKRDAMMAHPNRLSHRRASQICGQCHNAGEYGQEEMEKFATCGFSYRPGNDLLETLDTSATVDDEKTFWPDGRVRIAGREFNGLLASPCYERGEMSCMSCHVLHQSEDDPRPPREWADDLLGVGMDGNQACLQCHKAFEQDEALTAHTHHALGSSGSRCYNCHMPHTSYGILKAVRSHQIDSPDLKTSIDVGRPNACNLCHLDKTLAWTAGHLDEWYGVTAPELDESQKHVSEALLWLLSGDAGQRALAAWHMGWKPAREASGDQWLAPFLAELLDDPYDAVRYIAKRSLRRLPSFAEFEYDFIGGPDHRAAARERAIEQWRRTSKESLPSPEAILIDGNGNLRSDEIRRLIIHRSLRPVVLLE